MNAAMIMQHGTFEQPKMRVLVVDDDPVDRERCIRLLNQSKAGRFDIVGVESLDEAESQILADQFDCVLLDYHLKDHVGLEFANKHHREEDPPIVLLTGNGSENIASEALRSGVSDYLTKATMTATGLRRAVGNAIEKASLRSSVRAHLRAVEMANLTLHWRNNEIKQFYHSLSHEMKTPLTAAREYISLVSDGLLGDIGEEQHEFLTRALSCVDHLAMLFDDLVEATRLETGKLKLSRKQEWLDSIIVRAKLSAAIVAREKKVVLSDALEPDLPMVNVDAGRMLQVITNLLNNAIKFTEPGGHVEISARKLNDCWLEVKVLDTGCGIPIEHIDHIFERLYQVPKPDDENSAGGGLGLGLWIAREIILLHGGDIRVESAVGIGSAFIFTVPIELSHKLHAEEIMQ